MTNTTDVEKEIKELYKLKCEHDCPREIFDEFKNRYLQVLSNIIEIAYHVKAASSFIGVTPKYYWDNYIPDDEHKSCCEWSEISNVLNNFEEWLSEKTT